MGSVYSSEGEAVIDNVSDDKLITTAPRREDGDGMELPPTPTTAASDTTEQRQVEEASDTLNKSEVVMSDDKLVTPVRKITIPEAGLVLDKLPPIIDKVDLPASDTVSPDKTIVKQRARVYPKGSYPPSHKKNKEAKFVPYEPYKGAVAHMEKKQKKVSVDQINKSLDNSEVFEDSVDNSKNDDVMSESVEISSELEKNYRVMLDMKEKEINRLKEMMEVREKELKIQSKVNEEVKRLLVASVGEDIEARVEFLTQDKARLAADVLEYNNKIASDWERKEELGVEKDVWRSKFLASTVIVDELTRTKQTVVTRMEDLEHVARRLLLERTQLKQSLSSSQLMLDKLTTAFDPSQASRGQAQLDCLQSSDQLLRSVETLASRMMGGSTGVMSAELPAVHSSADTPAEAELKRLLSRPVRTEAKVPDQACSVLAKDARPHLLKLEDMAASPRGSSQFSTCSHCSGSVQDI